MRRVTERHRQVPNTKLPIMALDQICSRAPSSIRDGRLTSLDEPQSSQTCVTVLADDDVVVHGNAEVTIRTIALIIWMSGWDGAGSPEAMVEIAICLFWGNHPLHLPG
jgi:hypothetical protein